MSNNTTRRTLDEPGAQWGFQEGMVRLQLWAKGESDPTSIWMTPGQVLELIERGARAARLTLQGSL